MYRGFRRVAFLLLALSTNALPAQTSREKERERERQQEAKERGIERRAERLSKTIEKTVETSVDNAMRTVESALAGIDRHYYQGNGARQGSQERIDTTFAF